MAEFRLEKRDPLRDDPIHAERKKPYVQSPSKKEVQSGIYYGNIEYQIKNSR